MSTHLKFGVDAEGQRIGATPGQRAAFCPICDGPVIAKCGELRVWHWAHKDQRTCDAWHESEGPWHREWKSHFPDEWQEVVHRADSGERHVADVRTARGRIIEFQHSALAQDERRARDVFYPKLVWVVDASRRKSDLPKLRRAWQEGTPIGSDGALRRVYTSDALSRDWGNCQSPVFLDIGDGALVWLIGCTTPGTAYMRIVQRGQFISLLRDNTPESVAFDREWSGYPKALADLEAEIARQASAPPPRFEYFLARRRRFRQRH